MCSILEYVFDDKRVACLCLSSWLCLVVVLFYEVGILNSNYMRFGPSDSTLFMGTAINTWYRYSLVAGFTFVNTCVNDFMSDAISPWILNTITDHKSKYIPYRKATCISISQFWGLYCNMMSVFTFFLSLTQIDFVLIRTVADLCMSMYTTIKFLRFKVYHPSKYQQSVTHTEEVEMDSEHETKSFTIDEA